MKNSLYISFTLVIAMMLTILPFPVWAIWYQPVWILITLLFWMITLPHRVGIGTAFICGLLFDLLSGTTLGQHALIFTLIAYFIVRFQVLIHNLPGWQQIMLVSVITTFYLIIQYCVIAAFDLLPTTKYFQYWFPIISTTFLWPWIRVLLKDYQSRFTLD